MLSYAATLDLISWFNAKVKGEDQASFCNGGDGLIHGIRFNDFVNGSVKDGFSFLSRPFR